MTNDTGKDTHGRADDVAWYIPAPHFSTVCLGSVSFLESKAWSLQVKRHEIARQAFITT